MSKEQIEEMARIIGDCAQMRPFNNCDECREATGKYCSHIKLATKLYNAGYHKQSEWISVDDRLPDPFHTVLVYDTHTECVRISLYKGTDEVWRNGRISHWMPFPEPPKMKGGAE